jgi:hypothetical protein
MVVLHDIDGGTGGTCGNHKFFGKLRTPIQYVDFFRMFFNHYYHLIGIR